MKRAAFACLAAGLTSACRETPQPPAPPPAPASVAPPSAAATVSLPADPALARYRARALLEGGRLPESAAAFAALAATPQGSPFDAAGFLLASLLANPVEAPVVPAAVSAFGGRDPAVDYLLGHAHRRAGRLPDAVEAFRRAHAAAPEAPEAAYWLGVALVEAGREAEALAPLQALAGRGTSTGTLHPLSAQYRAARALDTLGRKDEATAALARYAEAFQARGQPSLSDTVLFQGPLTALSLPVPAALARPPAEPAPTYETQRLPAGKALKSLHLSWSGGPGGAPSIVVTDGRGPQVLAPAAPTPAPMPDAAGYTALAAADADADGDTDTLLADRKGLAFAPRDPTAGPPVSLGAAYPAEAALPADLDHDGDLDWVLTARGRSPGVLRALGPAPGRLHARFELVPDAAGLTAAKGATHAAALYADDDPRIDLVLAGPRLWLFRADRPGAFADVTAAAGLADTGPVAALAVEDFDADGRFDLLLASPSGTSLGRNLGGLRFGPALRVADAAASLAAGDFDADGSLDFAAAGASTGALCLGDGAGAFACRDEPSLAGLLDLTAADLDADGRLDLAGRTAEAVVRLLGRGATPARALRVTLEGVASNRGGVGSLVELQAGSRYTARLAGSGPVYLGLGPGDRAADVLRVRWPTSTHQSLLDQAPGAIGVREPAELMGSCPYLYGWDGQRFAFLGDILGQAPLGIPVAPGILVHPDTTEPFLIPREALAVENGRLRMALKEEFREVTYLDSLQLEAVDRPDGVHLVADGRCKAPPFPEQELYASAGVRPPRAARDTEGRDVMPLLAQADGRAVASFELTRTQGVVSTHTLELDLGPLAPGDRPVLYLDGWVYWGGSNTNAALFQDPQRPAHWPRVEVPDGRGGWRVAVADMGIPAGTTTRGIPVPLEGVVDPKDPRVRIVTNLQAYWDRALVGLDGGGAAATRHPVPAVRASFDHRGLATCLRTGGDGQGPADWDYHRLRDPLAVRWGQVPGPHTAYGDVRDLLSRSDDALVTLDAGDEILLEFDVSGLPPVPPGHRRDWLLRGDGWDKDTNVHTAGAEAVGPLPFHAMAGYPYSHHAEVPDSRLTRPPRALVPDLRLRALETRVP